MTFVDDVRKKAAGVVDKAKSLYAARQEQAESDVSPDPHVAGSRAKRDGEDGTYVGRTNPQYDAEVQESGAEARSEAARQSDDETN